MKQCISCKEPGEISLRALEVRTLPIRDLGGERKVQALGGFVDGAVCEKCARKQLALELDPLQSNRRSNMGFAIVFVMGILILILTYTLLKGQWVYAALGAAAIICGVLGLYDNIRSGIRRKKELSSLPEKKALYQAAWSVFVQNSPSKDGDADLSYIPIDEDTLRRKNGDLMILYKLLPAIAVEAYNQIHQKTG